MRGGEGGRSAARFLIDRVVGEVLHWIASAGAGTSGVKQNVGPIRDPPSESSASPQASSATRSSAMSCQMARSPLSPSKVYISKENLAGPATNSQVGAQGEQLNILVDLAHRNAHWQAKSDRRQERSDRRQKRLIELVEKMAEKLDVSTDGLRSEDEDEDPVDDLAEKLEAAAV